MKGLTTSFKSVFVILLFVFILCSCSNNIAESESSDTNSKIPETSSVADTDGSVIDKQSSKPIGGGSQAICPVHGSGYHGVNGSIIEKIGNDKFMTWAEPLCLEAYNDNECTSAFSLKAAVEEFDIPNEWLIESYYENLGYYTMDWDMESLLSRDWDAFDAYCRKYAEHDQEMQRRMTEFNLKSELVADLKESDNNEWLDYYNELTSNDTNMNVALWSIPEYVYRTGIDKDVIEKHITALSTDPRDGSAVEIFSYDLDKIWNEKDTLVSAMENLYPIQVDALLHK